MTPEDFERLQGLMSSRAGVRLTRDRMNLAAHRLGPVARREGFDGVEAMLAALWAQPVATLGWAVIEALLNSETWFFREPSAFDTLSRELMPVLAQARPGGRIKVWSAGCSTGQEAWSLAMAGAQAGALMEVVATDLSGRALEKAKAGLYTGFEIQRGLKARTMLDWFEQGDDCWRVKEALRTHVRFARSNLLEPPSDPARFDVIFCRYVLTDAEPDKRVQILDNLERRLADDGCLFLGADEHPENDTLAFRPVAGRKGLFVKAPANLRRAA